MSPHAPDPVAYLKALVACPSVTPAEGGALHFLADVLGGAGFAVERMVFSEPGTPDVENLFATIGDRPPHLVFAGHTDVVPPGDAVRWTHPPFAAEIAGGMLYGRGAVDMKGGIACFMAAAIGYLAAGGKAPGTLSLLITGDEEGPSINGTAKLIDWAVKRGCRFDAALVGEPTSKTRLGDMVKTGRRGGLSATIRVIGRQGHVAYPHLADNPVPQLVRILHRLVETRLDEGSEGFQASNLEVVSIDVGNPAFNVIPAEATARLNVRFNDHWTVARLQAFLADQVKSAAPGANVELGFHRSSEWFLTRPGKLVEQLSAAISTTTGLTPELSTSGGTSDARFFKDLCPVVEFGLVGDTMHQVDERVPLADLATLTAIYRGFLERYFAPLNPHA